MSETGDRWVDAGRFTICAVVDDSIYALVYWSTGWAIPAHPEEVHAFDTGPGWFVVFIDDPNAHVKLTAESLPMLQPDSPQAELDSAMRAAAAIAGGIIRKRRGLQGPSRSDGVAMSSEALTSQHAAVIIEQAELQAANSARMLARGEEHRTLVANHPPPSPEVLDRLRGTFAPQVADVATGLEVLHRHLSLIAQWITQAPNHSPAHAREAYRASAAVLRAVISTAAVHELVLDVNAEILRQLGDDT